MASGSISSRERECRRRQLLENTRSNWRLKRQVFLTLAQIYGPFPVDLFADRTNTQLPIFLSWKPDLQASQQLCLSPVQSNRGSPPQDPQGMSNDHVDCASLEGSSLVSQIAGYVDIPSSPAPLEEDLL